MAAQPHEHDQKLLGEPDTQTTAEGSCSCCPSCCQSCCQSCSEAEWRVVMCLAKVFFRLLLAFGGVLRAHPLLALLAIVGLILYFDKVQIGLWLSIASVLLSICWPCISQVLQRFTNVERQVQLIKDDIERHMKPVLNEVRDIEQDVEHDVDAVFGWGSQSSSKGAAAPDATGAASKSGHSDA